jgi:hypothetical protein
MHLKRGGALGDTYAAVTSMPGEPWLAILNLHQDTTPAQRAVRERDGGDPGCECWLDGAF